MKVLILFCIVTTTFAAEGVDVIPTGPTNICIKDEFRCKSGNVKCIPMEWKCDTAKDCEDGSDEEGCGVDVIPTGPPNVCMKDQFLCKSGIIQCIPLKWKCDSAKDCEDGSDEEGCALKVVTMHTKTYQTVIPQTICPVGHKLCNDGETCIPGLLLCDGIEDCPDGSDEKYGCNKAKVCVESFFFCSDKINPPCISRERVCDGVMDCTDGSDESLCDKCIPSFCVNGGTCSVQDRKPTCQCKPSFFHNRCGSSTMMPELPKEDEDKQTCLEEPDGGMCRGYFTMFYYDPKTQTCKEFIYGGCMGNGNRYVSEEECLDNCEGVVTWDSQSVCELPAETGLCRGFFKRFYFDSVTGRCQNFVYGGCGGNENNFESIDECEQRCGKKSAPSACQEDAESGPCMAAFRRYFFNKKTGKCEKFIYGGCAGNSNNFHTQEECEDVCIA